MEHQGREAPGAGREDPEAHEERLVLRDGGCIQGTIHGDRGRVHVRHLRNRGGVVVANNADSIFGVPGSPNPIVVAMLCNIYRVATSLN